MSVVIPAHDAEQTVRSAIESALRQSLAPHEIVVVDDGSTDETASVAAAFGAPVRVVSQPKGGPSAARNAGARAAQGDWIAWLDADDEWHPDKLAHQMRQVSPDAQGGVASRARADDIVIVATDWSRELVDTPAPPSVATTEVSTARLLLLNRFQTSTVLMRRKTFDAVGGFDSTLDGVEDWDMWLRSSRHGRVLKLDWPYVRYTDTATGYSKSLDRVYRTGWTMLERELGSSTRPHDKAILAWHHLRFATAYLLAGDRVSARSCLVDCQRAGRTAGVPEATVRYLAPFLAERAGRRIEALRGRVVRPRSAGSALTPGN